MTATHGENERMLGCRVKRLAAPRGGQSLVMIPALAKLLDEGIARGEGALDVAAAVRVPGG